MFYRIDELLGNSFEHAIVRIIQNVSTYKGARKVKRLSVEAITSSDFVIGGSSQYEAPFAETTKKLTEYINILKTGLSKFTGENLGAQFSITPNETIEFYKGSQKPEFSINLAFISLESGTENTALNQVKSLLRAVYPTFNKEDGFLQAPLGYEVKFDQSAKSQRQIKSSLDLSAGGTCTIEIGSYLSMPNMIITDANFTLSKQTIRDGTPLFATGSMTFKPAKMIHYDELMGYFNGGGVQSSYEDTNLLSPVSNLASDIGGFFS